MASNQMIANLPHYSALRRLKCQPQFERIMNSICKTHYHANILACRFVINELPEILAAPVDSGFVVITKAESERINKLKRILTNIHVDFDSEGPVTLKEYEKCLKYTIEFKIGPFWNRIGNFLIHGKTFLQTDVTEVSAVNLEYLIAGDEMIIETNQLVAKKLPIILDRIIDSNVLQNFYSDKNGVLDFDKLRGAPYYVTVIPSLQRARVISIFKYIPKDCPFEKYEDIYSHWKNMYGYILPKTSESLLFYKVGFPYWPDKTFIYPSVCVFSAPPQIVYDKKPLVNLHEALCFNMSQCIKTICGKGFNVSSVGKEKSIAEYHFTPSNRILNSNSKPTVPASGQFTFEISQKNETQENVPSDSESQRSVNQIVSTPGNLLVQRSFDLLTCAKQETIPVKKTALSQKAPSNIKKTYKSIIPNTPHISEYFSEKKFKIVSVNGYKEGKEIQRGGIPVDRSRNMFINLSSSNMKPLFEGAEVTRKET